MEEAKTKTLIFLGLKGCLNSLICTIDPLVNSGQRKESLRRPVNKSVFKNRYFELQSTLGLYASDTILALSQLHAIGFLRFKPWVDSMHLRSGFLNFLMESTPGMSAPRLRLLGVYSKPDQPETSVTWALSSVLEEVWYLDLARLHGHLKDSPQLLYKDSKQNTCEMSIKLFCHKFTKYYINNLPLWELMTKHTNKYKTHVYHKYNINESLKVPSLSQGKLSILPLQKCLRYKNWRTSTY